MHSSSSLRSRQRTLTSCTECRRRKQKCNQTKDRPCSNCARRYPPVQCTYLSHESSSAKGSRRGSPSGNSDRGRSTPKMDEHLAASDNIQRGSASPYGSMTSPQEYPSLPLEQTPTYPDSPELYYPPLQQHVNYPQETTFTSPTFCTAPTNPTYLTSPASATSTTTVYSNAYYSPLSATQSNWTPTTTESREYMQLSGSYGEMNDLDSSSINPDLFQFFGPLPHARWRKSTNMAWGVDPMDRPKPIDIPSFLRQHTPAPHEGCAEEGLKAWQQPALLCATKSFFLDKEIMLRFRLDEFNLMPMNSDDDRLQLDCPRPIHGTAIVV